MSWKSGEQEVCGLCGKIATGNATLDDVRYCHGMWDNHPTCYEQVDWYDDLEDEGSTST